ncbi:MAG: SDR family oxidoreductase [Alphaproteobacteria bacterium]|nr:SDR family oxidoreductase [Alphaproteobacteria bacterium]
MRVFITGAGGGIGGAIKDLYIEKGHDVIAPRSFELDLSDINAVKKWFSENEANFDAIIHCAGFNQPMDLIDMPYELYQKTHNVNVASLIEIIKANDNYFKKNGGFVVGIASLYASITREKRTAYTTSKHALVGLIKTLALEYGKYNVLCNTVSPGFVDTLMFQTNNSLEKRNELAQKTALNRLAKPQDIANMVYFLGSNNNTYVTGQDIIVDGGFMAGSYQ